MEVHTKVGVHALSNLLPDLADLGGPRYQALSAALAALLLDGRLSPGVRLPSERDLAARLDLSRVTVTAAYNELAADGMLERRRGSGSFLMLPATARVTGPGSRMSRRDHDAVLDLSIACLPALPNVLESAMTGALRQLPGYAATDGYQPYGISALRVAVAERFCARGVPTSVENVLITNGAQHGLDLILRSAVNPGDRVLTEMPTYPGALEAIRAHSARTVAVPFATSGRWDTAAIRNALLQTSPRLGYLIPDFHNPTGVLANAADRDFVAHAARRAGSTLVIDESFIDIDLRDEQHRADVPPMAALDSSVLSIGSLSKPVWGGLRVGWIRADPDTVQRLAIARARSDMSGPVIEQLMAVQLLSCLDEMIAARRAELRLRRDTLLSALAEKLPDWRPSRAEGGLSTWVELDAPAATPLTHLLERRGVLLTPGSRFSVDGTLERYLRIPFAQPPAVLADAVERIASAWRGLDHSPVSRTSAALVPA
jgi:DNA-binding transcriptional MocR family regulator